MKNNVVAVEIRGIMPSPNGTALFLGNADKTFVIQVDNMMGMVISMFLRNEPKERPLTHDLINQIFDGLGITVERVVITELRNATYYARLILKQENELGTKLVEVDARPSDCIALATAHKRPILVARRLFEEVEDMSELFTKMNEQNDNSESS